MSQINNLTKKKTIIPTTKEQYVAYGTAGIGITIYLRNFLKLNNFH